MHPEIPRVHLQRIRHVLADTHELAQDDRRMLRALLRDHELHRSGVHPIPEGGVITPRLAALNSACRR